ncbi:DJ-1/PfpI family protein [Saccharibacter sp. 17.LH.SD]|uniref:DJ-1/PfpI family protein n=1 Tax=Saccharibacter sp. 17.LH.SD TaxID=2689393 RepID=UPI0013691CA3|nr:DJ-1/PfpI family protein [Saccharibacter sp. 17.LH.SD]MXV44295.1 DJ-1/PfpI family protein [Saccharibacter sp. 17.LH.SD]
MHVVMLLYPGFDQLDLTGPFEVMGRFPEMDIHLVWKNLDLVKDNLGLQLSPTKTFFDCPQADILFVPGGPGQLSLIQDQDVLDFLSKQAAGASWVTSVCTGSLVLAAAGLLSGYRATCHWLSINQLSLFGAIPVSERVVRDRNRVTGAGVTSGIDFALTFCAELFGEDRARRVQLAMEYDPAAPFHDGSPARADPHIVEAVREASKEFQKLREEVALSVSKKIKARQKL